MDEEKLVEAVRGYPCLWMLTEKGYKDGKHIQEHESTPQYIPHTFLLKDVANGGFT